MRAFLYFPVLLLAGLLAGCPQPAPDDDSAGDDDSATDDDDSAGDDDAGDDDAGDDDAGDDDDSADDDDAGDDDDVEGPIAVAGSWTDGWSFHVITDSLWSVGTPPEAADHAITQYDNDVGFAVAQNAADDPWNPNLWSRFDWTWAGPDLYYCQAEYDGATEADALASTQANRDNLDGGCNGFSWSMLTPDQGPVAVIGDWSDGWYSHEVRQDHWTIDPLGTPSLTTFSQYSNEQRWVVGQNASNHPWAADLWSRFEWTWAGLDLYYCQTAWGAADEAAALATPPADPADPANGGCGGFPWSPLTAL